MNRQIKKHLYYVCRHKHISDVQEWEKVEASAQKLLDYPRLSEEDEYNWEPLLGQALFRQEKWLDCIDSLAYAGLESPDERTRNLCNIMQVRFG